jgi:hypothetical protein
VAEAGFAPSVKTIQIVDASPHIEVARASIAHRKRVLQFDARYPVPECDGPMRDYEAKPVNMGFLDGKVYSIRSRVRSEIDGPLGIGGWHISGVLDENVSDQFGTITPQLDTSGVDSDIGALENASFFALSAQATNAGDPQTASRKHQTAGKESQPEGVVNDLLGNRNVRGFLYGCLIGLLFLLGFWFLLLRGGWL